MNSGMETMRNYKKFRAHASTFCILFLHAVWIPTYTISLFLS